MADKNNTKIPRWLVGLLITAVSVGIAYGVSKANLDSLGNEIDSLEKKVEKKADTVSVDKAFEQQAALIDEKFKSLETVMELKFKAADDEMKLRFENFERLLKQAVNK